MHSFLWLSNVASPTQWTWVWVNSGNRWWTGRPGVLWFMGSQRVRHDWVNWTELNIPLCIFTTTSLSIHLSVMSLSNMETYIIICKIDSQWEFAVWLRKLKRVLYQTRGVGLGGRWEGGSKGQAYMYTYGWFMLRFDRKQQNSVKQLSFN